MQKLATETHSLLCRKYSILWMLIARVNQKARHTDSLLHSLSGPVSSKYDKRRLVSSGFFLPEQFLLYNAVSSTGGREMV